MGKDAGRDARFPSPYIEGYRGQPNYGNGIAGYGVAPETLLALGRTRHRDPRLGQINNKFRPGNCPRNTRRTVLTRRATQSPGIMPAQTMNYSVFTQAESTHRSATDRSGFQGQPERGVSNAN